MQRVKPLFHEIIHTGWIPQRLSQDLEKEKITNFHMCNNWHGEKEKDFTFLWENVAKPQTFESAQYAIFSLSGCSPNPQLTKVHQKTVIIPLPPQAFCAHCASKAIKPYKITGLLCLKQPSSCKNSSVKILNTWSHSAAGKTITDWKIQWLILLNSWGKTICES